MSDLPRSEPSTEPRGLRLRYDPPGPAHAVVDNFDRLRSQLITTAVVAGCVIVLLASAGFGAIAAGLYPTTNVAFGLAASTVLVGIVAAFRVSFLFRALQQVLNPIQVPIRSAPVPSARENTVEPESWPAPPALRVAEQRPFLAVPAEFGSPAFADGIQQWGDVFGKLSRRLQSLVNRLIRSIDKMEHELEDPDLLDMLWGIDHLATLVRRQAENIAVLGGETLERRSDNPVDVNAVLRSAVAEIQRYRQVVTVPMRDARIHGHVVAEIIHLLSELLDNATSFSSDDAPKVAFRAQYVTAGLAIQVQDRGIGMDTEDLRRINHLLDRATPLDVGELFKDGRIGLAVVKELARRHGIGVEMQHNIYGGIDASIVVPHKLLDSRPVDGVAARRSSLVARETNAGRATDSRAAMAVAPPASQPAQRPTPQPVPSGQTAAHRRPSSLERHSQADVPATAPESPRRPETQPDVAHTDQPALPVRGRGTTFSAIRAGQAVDADRAADAGDRRERPALPQRREQPSHLRSELRETPVLSRPIPGHSTSLLADLQLGQAAGQREIAQGEAKSASTGEADELPQRTNERHIEGDKGSWPTI